MYESYEYWFNNKEHDDSSQFDENYFIYKIYKELILKLEIPKDGFIVVAGTNNCVSFDLLCRHFGYERCIGFDLYNPKNHPRVITKSCWDLSEIDNIPIAFAHNDVGSYPTTPELKLFTQKWLIKNVIADGFLLSNNNINSAKYNLEQLSREQNFYNTNLCDLDDKKFNLSSIDKQKLESYMICKKQK
jgi:hypothetical protein